MGTIIGRLVTLTFIAFLLVGCANAPVKLRTETQEVFKPILYCPAPNWAELDRPILAIDGITLDTPPGEVAKRYKASILQLENYATRLEHALRRYDATNEAYNMLKEEFLKQKTIDGFITNQSTDETPEE